MSIKNFFNNFVKTSRFSKVKSLSLSFPSAIEKNITVLNLENTSYVKFIIEEDDDKKFALIAEISYVSNNKDIVVQHLSSFHTKEDAEKALDKVVKSLGNPYSSMGLKFLFGWGLVLVGLFFLSTTLTVLIGYKVAANNGQQVQQQAATPDYSAYAEAMKKLQQSENNTMNQAKDANTISAPESSAGDQLLNDLKSGQ